MTASQSWEAWKGLETEETHSRLALVSGQTAVSSEVAMSEDHPYFEEWRLHVDSQSHQGC